MKYREFLYLSLRTLHWYILKQCLATLLLTVAVCTFVLVTGNLLKEILELVVAGRITFPLLGKALLLLSPYVLSFSLPIATLLAVLMVFGRFSADQEYTAARSAGISLFSLISPVIIMAIVASAMCAWCTLSLSPAARIAYKKILSNETINVKTFIPEGKYINFSDKYILYISKIRNNNLSHIRFYQFENGIKTLDVTAPSGDLIFGETNKTIKLVLEQARVLTRLQDISLDEISSPETDSQKQPEESIESTWMPLFLGEYETEEIPLFELSEASLKDTDISDLPLKALVNKYKQTKQQELDTRPILSELHHRVAFSFACITFTLLGIPISIRSQRRETNISLALALVIVLTYIIFFILGEAVAENLPIQYHPWLIFWIPNILFLGVALYLLHRTNNGVG